MSRPFCSLVSDPALATRLFWSLNSVSLTNYIPCLTTFVSLVYLADGEGNGGLGPLLLDTLFSADNVL